MSRRWWVVGLAVLVLVTATVAGWAVTRGDDYDHALQRYGEAGEPNVYVNLPDGEAQLALGSPDGHRLVVQWRDPDGEGWTAPETVWEDRRNRAFENTVRYGGGTVAIVETYSTEPNSDSDASDKYVAVVCRDRTCAARARSVGPEAQVTPDGATVYLGQSDTGVLFWESSGGFHEARWQGHPRPDSARSATSPPVLAPDGSLRLVRSGPARGGCTFELFTTPPVSAALTARATRTQPVPGWPRSLCLARIRTWSDSWVEVNTDDFRMATFWFVDENGGWRSSARDASGLDLVRVRRCCDSRGEGFVHWNDVTFASPDGRRIQVQTHLLGDEQWGEPVVLEAAPAGTRCRGMSGQEAGPHGYAVVMTCRDGLAVAASPDLRQWTATYLRDVSGEPIGDDDGLRVGRRLVWTPAEGFR